MKPLGQDSLVFMRGFYYTLSFLLLIFLLTFYGKDLLRFLLDWLYEWILRS